MDHDQRFKLLLQAFLKEFLELFFPDIARRIDFAHPVEWLNQEVFLDPPRGRKRILDLIAKLRTLEPPVTPPSEGVETLALIHIEIEGEDTVAPLRADMYHCYEVIRRNAGLPVLPLAVYLQVGLEGRGTDVYEEHFWEYRTVRFEYQYVGLPALDAATYAAGDNLLGVALVPLMRMAEELTARIIQRIGACQEDRFRKELLGDCVMAYADLSDAQREELDRLLNTESYKEGLAMRNSLLEHAKREAIQLGMEQGKQQGRQEGLQEGRQEGLQQGQRQLLQTLLETRFGPLSEQARSRLESWPVERLPEIGQGLVAGKSLQELGLEG